MGKKAPSPPPAPDPIATANAQGQWNEQTARTTFRMNAVNQNTPFGRQTWNTLADDPGVRADLDRRQADAVRENANNPDFNVQQWRESAEAPFKDRWSTTVELSPAQQRLLDLSQQGQEIYGNAAVQQLRTAAGTLGQPFRPDLPPMQMEARDRTGGMVFGVDNRNPEYVRTIMDRGGELVRDIADRTGEVIRAVPTRSGELVRDFDFGRYGDPNVSRERVEGALMERMAPLMERDRAGLEQRLANQGITFGSQAWRAAMDDQARAVNDARLGAILNAGQEQNRLVDLAATDMGARNQATGQAQGLDTSAAEFANNATMQVQNMDLQRAGFRNAATGQLQDMDLQRGQFANAVTGQLNQNDLARAGFTNSALAQAANMDMARMQFGNQARGQSLQEQVMLRRMPLEEAQALLTGQMIQQPQFQPTPQVQVAPVNYAGIVQNGFDNQMQLYGQQMQNYRNNQQIMGQLIGQGVGMGVSALTGGFGGGFGSFGKMASTGFGMFPMDGGMKSFGKAF